MSCPNSPPIVVQHGNKVACVKPDCWNWSCDYCRPKKIQAYIEHLTAMVRRNAFLYVGTVDPDDWDRTRRKLGGYVKIEIGDGEAYFVLSTTPFHGARRESKHVAIQEAFGILESLRKPAGRHIYRPVSFCRAWSLEMTVTPWRRVCFASAGRFRKAVEQVAAKVRESVGAIFATIPTENLANLIELLTHSDTEKSGAIGIGERRAETERWWADLEASGLVNVSPCLSG